MKHTYRDLIEQNYDFPQDGFELKDHFLTFHGVSLKYLIDKYGSPFRFIYLPKIGDQIKKARSLFNKVLKEQDYKGKYQYCYCTKSNHFYHVVNETMKHDVHVETSSAYDIDLILNLFEKGRISKDRIIIHNGYKTDAYLKKIIDMTESGFYNSIIILDSINEYRRLIKIKTSVKLKLGIRMAILEAADSVFNTSRLGIPSGQILDFFKEEIQGNPNVELLMFHFFVDSGIKDTSYYWGQFQTAIQKYVELKQISKDLNAFNIGGGFPIQNSLGFEYDYEFMINKIVHNIKEACDNKVDEPDIFTEFGKYTVGESGAIIFEVLEQKEQNDNELWYIINNSLMNTIPDAWTLQEKFILLPINKWNNGFGKVNIGGTSCDHLDYYNSEDLNQEILLPLQKDNDEEPLYLGFFHTGAYQDSVSGYGGIKHCLIPSPMHVIIDRDDDGNIIDYVYREEQTAIDMFKILGYN